MAHTGLLDLPGMKTAEGTSHVHDWAMSSIHNGCDQSHSCSVDRAKNSVALLGWSVEENGSEDCTDGLQHMFEVIINLQSHNAHKYRCLVPTEVNGSRLYIRACLELKQTA